LRDLVLKAGGSVLRDRESYLALARNCLSLFDEYDRLHVIVSARKGETSRLLNDYCDGNDAEIEVYNWAMKGQIDPFLIDQDKQKSLASHLIQGEIDSARELGSCFDELGFENRIFEQGNRFPIIANHNYLMSVLDLEGSINRYLESELKPVNVYAGFGAENNEGEKVLLGRNRSDLVAAVVAHLVKARNNDLRLIFLKDQDGIIRNFGKENAELIPRISVDELANGSYDQILCSDVYDWIDGFEVGICNSEKFDIKNPGTIIYRGGYHV